MKGKNEHHFIVTVRKFKAKNKKEIKDKNIKPYETLTSKHSDLLDEGADELIKLLLGIGGAIDFGETAYVGVGTSSVEFDATHTDLQGNPVYVVVDAQPTLETDQKAQWKATFGDGIAEQSWQEFTVSNTSNGDGKNLMRILADKGTKGSGETWELTITEEFA